MIDTLGSNEHFPEEKITIVKLVWNAALAPSQARPRRPIEYEQGTCVCQRQRLVLFSSTGNVVSRDQYLRQFLYQVLV
jgi:hypothetical protein